MLIFPLNVFPWVINGLIEAWVSLNRVNKFLILEKLDCPKFYTTELGGEYDPHDLDELIVIFGGQFTWTSNTAESEVDFRENGDNMEDSKTTHDTVVKKEDTGKPTEYHSASQQQSLHDICITVHKVI